LQGKSSGQVNFQKRSLSFRKKSGAWLKKAIQLKNTFLLAENIKYCKQRFVPKSGTLFEGI